MDVLACFTPYHLVLAHTLVAQHGLERPTLVLSDEAGLLEALPRAADGFARLVELEAVKDGSGLGKADTYARNVARLQAELGRERLARLYVFNPQRPESRWLLGRRAATAVFVEDGLEPYVAPRPLDAKTRLLRLVNSLRLGVRPPPNGPYVGYHDWDEAYFLVPEAALGPLLPGVARAVDRSELRRVLERWSAWARLPVTERHRALLLLPHTGETKRSQTVGTLLEASGVAPEEAIVKPHPRDVGADEALTALGSLVADRRVPAELYAAALPPGATVVGTASTALLTAAVTRPDLTVRYVGSGRAEEMARLLAVARRTATTRGT